MSSRRLAVATYPFPSRSLSIHARMRHCSPLSGGLRVGGSDIAAWLALHPDGALQMRSNLFAGIELVFAGRPQQVERWRIACAAVHWELAWRHEPTTIAVSYRGRQSPVVRILQISPRGRDHGRAVQPMSCSGLTLKSREAIWISRKRLGKDLDRDFPLQPRVARDTPRPCRLRRWRKRSRTARVECRY
jgi:hypothetical protein